MKGKLVKTIAAVCAATMLFGMTALAAPKTMSDGGTFDPEYYAQQNPDVVAALGTDENVLYQHYLNNGKAEGRLPYAAGIAATTTTSNVKTMSDGGKFDPTYYAQQNPDVVAVLGTDENVLYEHYLNNGKAEGRLPYASEASAATVIRTRKYYFNSATAKYSIIKRLYTARDKKNVITLQEMSDGTIKITQTGGDGNSYVFANTGKRDIFTNQYMYRNTASTDGKTNNVELIYYDTVLGLEFHDDEGSFSYGETYYEK